MSDSLFLLRGEEPLVEMSEAQFDSEDVFQELLARFPSLLTNSTFGESTPRRWVLVSREAAISDRDGGPGRWSLDHLFLDQEGVPTLVEVKRATDGRARREVVAQMLDYAANAVSWWRVDDIIKAFEEESLRQNTNSLLRIAALLRTEDPDIESYWRGVQANLGSGRIRLIFVADRIAPELQRIVEFLNEQMNPAVVVALELRPFSSGADRILAPRLVGVTSRASAQKSVERPSPAASVDEWFSSTFTSMSPDSLETTKRFLDMMYRLGATIEVAGQSLAVEYGTAHVRAAYVRPNGRVALSGWMLAKTSAFESDEVRAGLVANIAALGLPLSSRNPSGEPTFTLPNPNEATVWQRLEEFFLQLFQKLPTK